MLINWISLNEKSFLLHGNWHYVEETLGPSRPNPMGVVSLFMRIHKYKTFFFCLFVTFYVSAVCWWFFNCLVWSHCWNCLVWGRWWRVTRTNDLFLTELIIYYLFFDTEFARIFRNDLVVYKSFSLMIRFAMLLKFYDHSLNSMKNIKIQAMPAYYQIAKIFLVLSSSTGWLWQ